MTIFLIIGNITQPNNLPLPDKNSKIYMLDVRSYTWVYTFDAPPSASTNTTSTASTSTSISSVGNNPPIPTSTSTNSSESSNQITTMKVVIAAIGSILGTTILMTIVFFGYKCHKKRQRERTSVIMRVHGNAT